MSFNRSFGFLVSAESHNHDDRYFTETEMGDSSTNGSAGAKLIGTFDEFDNSDSINVQDVLKDFDAKINLAVSGGEVNTGLNAGTAGTGVFYQKSGPQLQFKNINTNDSHVNIVDDGVNHEIDISTNATNLNTASTIVARDASGNFSAGTIDADLAGNSSSTTSLETTRNIALGGDVTGNADFNGTSDITITATVVNDSHTHDTRYYTETESDANFLGIHANADSASKLNTSRTIGLTGDASGSVSFDGSANVNISTTVDKVDGKDVDDAQTSTAYLWTAGKIINYITGKINGLDWQESVKDKDLSTPPGTPATGDRYIIKATGTGDWAGHDNDITEWSGTAWTFIDPTEGGAAWVEDEDKNYTFNGTSWVTFGSTQTHNNLSGLQGGTPNEYYHLTNAQHSDLTDGGDTTLHTHDSRYFTETESNANFLGIHANADSASKLNTARTISLGGDASGSVSFDGSANVTITATVANDSHTHDSRYYTETESLTHFLRRDASSSPTTNNTLNLGDVDHVWANIYATNFNGTATYAKYADLAEKYTMSNEDYKLGDVVALSLDEAFDVEVCNEISSSRVIGVVSTAPAFCMNKDLEGGVYIALKGRVPCKVQGPVKKGDSLISGNNGAAVSIANGRYNIVLRIDTVILGIANETIESDEVKIIEVVI